MRTETQALTTAVGELKMMVLALAKNQKAKKEKKVSPAVAKKKKFDGAKKAGARVKYLCLGHIRDAVVECAKGAWIVVKNDDDQSVSSVRLSQLLDESSSSSTIVTTDTTDETGATDEEMVGEDLSDGEAHE